MVLVLALLTKQILRILLLFSWNTNCFNSDLHVTLVQRQCTEKELKGIIYLANQANFSNNNLFCAFKANQMWKKLLKLPLQ